MIRKWILCAALLMVLSAGANATVGLTIGSQGKTMGSGDVGSAAPILDWPVRPIIVYPWGSVVVL